MWSQFPSRVSWQMPFSVQKLARVRCVAKGALNEPNVDFHNRRSGAHELFFNF